MSQVQLVRNAFGPKELESIDRLRLGCPGYNLPGHPLPQRLRFGGGIGRRRMSRLRFAPELGGREDTGRYHQRLAEHARAEGRPLVPGAAQYFRATYARNSEPLLPGVFWLLGSERLADLAARCHPAEVVYPFTVYANVYLPGQRLDAHTDVPAFRGATIDNVAPWLLVVMHHSGRFARWQLPVATAVAYPDACRGGDFTYQDSEAAPCREAVTVTAAENTAVVLDADRVFHQVDEVAGGTSVLSELGAGVYLRAGPAGWTLARDEAGSERPLATFRTDELRFSLSWKAYCFVDSEAEHVWAEHTDDLDTGSIIATLVDELCRRSVLAGPEHGLSDADLAAVLIDELVPFPAPGWSDPGWSETQPRLVPSGAARTA